MSEPRGPLVGTLIGAGLYALMLVLAGRMQAGTYAGEFLYNYYFLALIDGRLDVPAQIAGLEGFYDAEGRAFVYHGLGPLLTRALAWPFIDLTAVDLRGPTIWAFATIGAAGFYAAALSVLGERAPGLLVWAMLWVLAPGFILAANGSFYHEPLGFAFAMAGVGIYCLWRLVDSDFRAWGWLIGLALAAALAVHGRPHVAVGLYAAAGVSGLIVLTRMQARALMPVGLAMVLMLVSGLGYLQMNKLRFGAATEVVGTVSDGEARTVYGFRYWGWEPEDAPRFKSQETHGDFMAGRILPNLFLYSVSMGDPRTVGLYRRMTAEMGHIRLESPVFGFAFFWLPWVILAVSALVRRGGPRAFLWLGLLATVPAALVILSYTTITLRYRIEIWPVLFVPGIMALSGFLARDRSILRGVWVASIAAFGVSLLTVGIYHDVLNWEWTTALRDWDDCARMVREHPGLGAAKVTEICVLGEP